MTAAIFDILRGGGQNKYSQMKSTRSGSKATSINSLFYLFIYLFVCFVVAVLKRM